MNSSSYFAVFYVEALYHLPHFLPVADEMQRRGLPHGWLFKNETERTIARTSFSPDSEFITGRPEDTKVKTEFFIFGNSYRNLGSVHGVTVLIYHGIGTKSCYYEDDLADFDIRFVEGEYRRRELDSRSPNRKQDRPVVGFSKLDPAVYFNPTEREASLISLGLIPSRKTILYAPTYYPSSIELMNRDFPDELSDFNIIIKPHQFSYSDKYKKQRLLMEHWKGYDNVYLAKPEDFDILPFFSISDVMISDESSAIFEFAALGRPVIRNRFVKLRPSYRIFPWKLRKRMDSNIEQYFDIARNAYDYTKTLQILQDVIKNPSINQTMIQKYSNDLLGEIDGKVSERIVDYLFHKNHA
jgi:hypothetical protein